MDDHPACGLVFLLGCLGALAPEILRLYKERWQLKNLRFSLGYFAISAVYASLGGVMALILQPSNMRTAIYAGLTLDVTLSAIAKNRKRTTATMANESNTIRAVDMTDKANTIRASAATQTPFYNAKQLARRWIAFIRDHADGLFL
jgi:hypothetical protein